VSGHRTSKAGVVAILIAIGSVAGASQAEAALYYWQDYDPGYYRPAQPFQQRRPKARRTTVDKSKKPQGAEKDAAAKPQGPLVISVALDQQKVRVYDSRGLFAESPISSGMRGHSTPMGVFSVIQKHKYHHSNIYSGAPMPYMQRITWSGIALHAGVLPGYPASHGCIRMPMAFAQKMWIWTKMGARVLVTPGDMAPVPFSHALLVTQKVVPQPLADEAPKVDAPVGVKSDKGADATPEIARQVDTADAKLELRSSVGHALTHTADASGLVAADAAVTMSDASPAAASGEASPVKLAQTTQGADNKSADSKPAEITTGEIKAVPAADRPKADASVAVEPKAGAKAEAKVQDARPEAPTAPETPRAEVPKAETPKADALKADAPKAIAPPAEPAKALTDVSATKDPSRLPGQERAKTELKREGQLAVFISGKDGKLYVRQNFKPVFETPVTIAPSDKLLGTHVFTAEVDRTDPNLLRWSVLSLPVTARNAQRNDLDEHPGRRRKAAGAPPAPARSATPNTASEALDRITIPQEIMAKIAEALTTGGSIVVSDQGINQGETGEGTDFIVRLR
jgi:lipoprotein-anchoring transpeptidase ErfK/SrfK